MVGGLRGGPPFRRLHRLTVDDRGAGGGGAAKRAPEALAEAGMQGLQRPVATPGAEVVINGLITNDKFCLTRCGRLALTWPRSHPLPRAWRQGSAAYAPRDDPHRRGGRHASPAHALVAPTPSTVPSPGRAAALGSRVSVPTAVHPNSPCTPATAPESPVARTGEGGGQP